MRLVLLLAAVVLLLPAAALSANGPGASPADAGEATTSDTTPPDLDLARHVRTRTIINGAGMATLGAWSVASMTWGGIGLATSTPGTKQWSFHQMNLVWGGIDLAIASLGGVWVGVQARHPGDAVSILRGGQRMTVLYAVNLGLDIGYVAMGALMEPLGRLQGNPALEGYGPAIALQGAVLLAFDTVLVLANAIHDDALLRRARPRFATLPPRLRAPRFAAGPGALSVTF